MGGHGRIMCRRNKEARTRISSGPARPGPGSMIRMAVDLATGRCILDHATTTLETGGVRGGVWAFLFLWGLGRFRARDRGSAGGRARAYGTYRLVPALLHQFPPAHRPGPGAQPQGPGARARLGPRASVITYLCADYRVHGLESAAERPVRDRVTTCLISHDTCYKWH